MASSALQPQSLRRHPLHTAGRLAQLARIGLKHPRSRLHVLEFDCGHNSDALIASLRAARGMPLLLADQLLVLGGSVAPTAFAPVATLVGGRLLRPRPSTADSVSIDSEPFVDPDIAFDVRIAEKALRHVGFLAPSELFLANAILRQSVEDVAVDVGGNARVRAQRGARIFESNTGRPANLTFASSREPSYAVPATAGMWTSARVAVLVELWAQLLFGEGCVLRHLTQRTVTPTADGVALTCLDSLRRVPTSAVTAGHALVAAGTGDAAALRTLIAHLRDSSGGAESAASYGAAAQRVVARSGARVHDIVQAQRHAFVDSADIPELDEPFATCLVIGHIVALSRLLEYVGSPAPGVALRA